MKNKEKQVLEQATMITSKFGSDLFISFVIDEVLYNKIMSTKTSGTSKNTKVKTPTTKEILVQFIASQNVANNEFREFIKEQREFNKKQEETNKKQEAFNDELRNSPTLKKELNWK